MVEITTYSLSEKIVVIETGEGKVKLTFDEWKKIVDAYEKMVKKKE